MCEKNLEKSGRPTRTLTKVNESGGMSSQINLVKSNQFPNNFCHRTDCLLCFQKGGNKTECQKNNIGYEGQCGRSKQRVVYTGESSKPAYTRIKQHNGNYKAAANAKLPALPNLRQTERDNVV